jgi:aarF domain-containing kinase
MNSGEFFALLGAILTMKPWDEIVGKDINRLQAKSTKGDAVMMSIYAEKYFKQINVVLGQVPSDMLLLLKTNDCLRHLDRLLKNPINTAAGNSSYSIFKIIYLRLECVIFDDLFLLFI